MGQRLEGASQQRNQEDDAESLSCSSYSERKVEGNDNLSESRRSSHSEGNLSWREIREVDMNIDNLSNSRSSYGSVKTEVAQSSRTGETIDRKMTPKKCFAKRKSKLKSVYNIKLIRKEPEIEEYKVTYTGGFFEIMTDDELTEAHPA